MTRSNDIPLGYPTTTLYVFHVIPMHLALGLYSIKNVIIFNVTFSSSESTEQRSKSNLKQNELFKTQHNNDQVLRCNRLSQPYPSHWIQGHPGC
jgi:hypothetical protein